MVVTMRGILVIHCLQKVCTFTLIIELCLLREKILFIATERNSNV